MLFRLLRVSFSFSFSSSFPGDMVCIAVCPGACSTAAVVSLVSDSMAGYHGTARRQFSVQQLLFGIGCSLPSSDCLEVSFWGSRVTVKAFGPAEEYVPGHTALLAGIFKAMCVCSQQVLKVPKGRGNGV